MKTSSRLLLIKALADELGLEGLKALEMEAVRTRPVPPRLVARLALAHVLGPNLTPRQREVMVLLTSGLTRREIAEELGVSTETVKNHLSHIYLQLNVRNRVEAINAFLEQGS